MLYDFFGAAPDVDATAVVATAATPTSSATRLRRAFIRPPPCSIQLIGPAGGDSTTHRLRSQGRTASRRVNAIAAHMPRSDAQTRTRLAVEERMPTDPSPLFTPLRLNSVT